MNNPERDYLLLTDIDIERCQTPKGGYLAESVRLLGEDVSIFGWKRRLRGKRVSRIDYDQARSIASLPKLRGIPGGESRGQMALM